MNAIVLVVKIYVFLGKVLNGDGHRKNSVESTTSTNSSVDAGNKKKEMNGDGKDKLDVKPGK